MSLLVEDDFIKSTVHNHTIHTKPLTVFLFLFVCCPQSCSQKITVGHSYQYIRQNIVCSSQIHITLEINLPDFGIIAANISYKGEWEI